MKKILILLLVACFILPIQVDAKRSVPKEITIYYKKTKYKAPHWWKIDGKGNQPGGYVEAWDTFSNKIIWRTKVYSTKYQDKLEHDVQDIFIIDMWLKNDTLYVKNEKNYIYLLNSLKGTLIINKESSVGDGTTNIPNTTAQSDSSTEKSVTTTLKPNNMLMIGGIILGGGLIIGAIGYVIFRKKKYLANNNN